MLQTAHVFNARPIEAYSRNAFSLIGLLAADAQTAFYPDTGTVELLLAALRPKVRAFDLSYKYGLIFLRKGSSSETMEARYEKRLLRQS